MWAGVLAALGAGLLWGLLFLVPLLLAEYPGVILSFGRYTAFGLLAVGLAWMDRTSLARLRRADWIEATWLSLVGNILYYALLASAIQLAGAPVPTLIIGTLPVVIAVSANLLAGHGTTVGWGGLAGPLALIFGGLTTVQLGGDVTLSAANGSVSWTGIALALLAVACWTWYPLRNSRWLKAHPPGMARAWATAQGLVTLPLALGTGALYALWERSDAGSGSAFSWPLGPQPLLFVSLMVVTGLTGSWLGTLLWNRASQLLPPALLGQLIVFETLAALVYAFVWYARLPEWHELAGIVMLVSGVLLGLRLFRGAAQA